MKPNISVLNAIMRITCGLTAVAWAASRLSKRPLSMCSLMIAMMGAMKVGEGVHRYCPVTDFVKHNMQAGEKEASSHEEE